MSTSNSKNHLSQLTNGESDHSLRPHFPIWAKGDKTKSRDGQKPTEETANGEESAAYGCELCGMRVNSLFQLKEHVKGKRHQTNAAETGSKGRGEESGIDAGYDFRIVTATFLGVWISVVLYLYAVFVAVDKYLL